MLRAESSLGLLHFSPQLLDGPVISPNVFACLLLVELDKVVHDSLVEVFTSKVSVSVGGYHLKYSIVDGEERHIKGTTTKIKYKDVLLSFLLIQAIGNGGCSSGGRGGEREKERERVRREKQREMKM